MSRCFFVFLLWLWLLNTQAQNVGIGTTTPSAKLDIKSDSSGVLIPRLSLSATNIAAPVTNPTNSTLVYNTSSAGSGSRAVRPGYYYWSDTMWVRIMDNKQDGNNYIKNDTSNTQAAGFNINGYGIFKGGRVGIGTATPTSALHLIHTSATDGMTLQNTSGGSGSQANLYFTTYLSSTGSTKPGARIAGLDNNYSADLTFSTKTPGADTNNLVERLRLTAAGSVGIGTTNPSQKLSIAGIGPTIGLDYGAEINVKNSSGSYEIFLTPRTTIGSAPNTTLVKYGSGGLFVSNSSNQLTFFLANNGNLGLGSNLPSYTLDVFGTLRAQYATFLATNASSNVGIGTTTPSQKLEVIGTTKTISLQVTNGAANGYLLQSDATGNASWVAPTSLTTIPGGTAAGDLAGTYPSPSVTKINGSALGNTTAAMGYLLIGNGAAWNSKPMSGDASIDSGGVLTIGSSSNNYVKNQSATDQTAEFRITGNGIFNGGNVGIGTPSPTQKLDVAGTTRTINFQMTAGTLASSVLTGDASGNANWAPNTPINMTGFIPALTSNADFRGVSVSASSSFSSSFYPWACMSGSIADWATSGVTSNFWIQVQLPVALAINRIGMRGRSSNEVPTSETIQGSNDGTTWTTLMTANTNLTYASGNMLFSFTNNTAYTYYRITFPTATGTNPGLCFLQLYRY